MKTFFKQLLVGSVGWIIISVAAWPLSVPRFCTVLIGAIIYARGYINTEKITVDKQ